VRGGISPARGLRAFEPDPITLLTGQLISGEVASALRLLAAGRALVVLLTAVRAGREFPHAY
jgi:hypothetical protein